MSETTPAPSLTQPAPTGAPGQAPTTPAPDGGQQPAPSGEAPNPFRLDGWKGNETLSPYEKQLGKFADPETGLLDIERLGKGYAELERFKGGPAPDPVTPEQFTKGIGEAEIPEGIDYPAEMREELANVAHEAGVDAESFRSMEKAMLDSMARNAQAFEQFRQQEGQKAYNEMEQEVGPVNIDNYLAKAKQAAETLGFSLDTNERTPERVMEIKAFAHIADKIGEATMPAGGSPTASSGNLSQAEDIKTNPNNPWHEAFNNPNHPQHQDAQKAYDTALYEAVKSGEAQHKDGGRV